MGQKTNTISSTLTVIISNQFITTKFVGMKNKALVIFDWLKAIVFGRDISKF